MLEASKDRISKRTSAPVPGTRTSDGELGGGRKSAPKGWGCLWQRWHMRTLAGLWWKHKRVLWRQAFSQPLPPPQTSPQTKADAYLQRVGQGCVSWAGRCCSSWDCCGGRRNFHPAADVASPEQRNQTKMLWVLRNARQAPHLVCHSITHNRTKDVWHTFLQSLWKEWRSHIRCN